MKLADAHCHLDFPVLREQLPALLTQAGALGIERMVIPGVQRQQWLKAEETAALSEALDYCLGLHPWFVPDHRDEDLDALQRTLAAKPAHCVGLGECGLDRLRGSLREQMPWFEAQVQIARDEGCPLVIHSVRSHDEVCSVLRRFRFHGRALLHGFAGSYQQASTLFSLGCRLGVGGVITHDRARKTRDTLSRMPAEALVLETDAPDMPPAGVAAGENSPLQLPRILQTLLGLRSESGQVLVPVLWQNVCDLYGWPAGDEAGANWP